MYWLRDMAKEKQSGKNCFKFAMHCPNIEDAPLSYSTFIIQFDIYRSAGGINNGRFSWSC